VAVEPERNVSLTVFGVRSVGKENLLFSSCGTAILEGLFLYARTRWTRPWSIKVSGITPNFELPSDYCPWPWLRGCVCLIVGVGP
jgi:hypothetical protein